MRVFNPSSCIPAAVSAAFLPSALSAPIPVELGSPAVAPFPAAAAVQTVSQDRLVAEMSDLGVAAIRSPVGTAGSGSSGPRGWSDDLFDASNPFDSFRPNFHEHWSAERGGPLRQRFGRTVYPGLLGGFGHFGDAIYAAHARFRPVYQPGAGTYLGAWLNSEFEELATLLDLFADAQLITPIADRFPDKTTGTIVVIPLPGPAGMALAGMMLIASRRRR